MKPSLQLKIGQSLTMTPQLQQAIRLLQLSTVELQHEIQEALESNPLLEIAEDQINTKSDDLDFNQEQPISQTPGNNNAEEKDISITNEQDIPNDLPVDSAWEDIYPNQSSSSGLSGSDEINFDEKNSQSDNLQDHLAWQVNLTRFTEKERVIAYAIIDAIDTRGYLTQDIESLLSTVQHEWQQIIAASQPDNEKLSNEADEAEEDINTIDQSDIEIVLKQIQQFDPPGVGAKNSEECLLIQLKQLHTGTPFRNEAINLLSNYANLLSQKDFNQLIKKTKHNKDTLIAIIALIKSLNPYPGDKVSNNEAEYVTPDVVVQKKEDRWVVELNNGTTPNLKINSAYADIKPKQSTDKGYIKQHLQEAKWFIKSLQSRNETLLKVATKIVEYQLEFFEKGPEFMRPLVLQVIAEAIDMHESTISRVTTQKYMHTPLGIFELKYFFSSHVSTTTGEDCSSTAIKAMIKKLIANEDVKKPLSDSKIANLLAEKGKNVARRTIAKYREAMNIPPSNERKQLL